MKKVLEIKTIGDAKYHCTAGYFTDNKWIDNDTFVYMRSESPEIGNEHRDDRGESEFVKLSLKDNSEKVIMRDSVCGFCYVVFGDKLYYSDGKSLKAVDINTKEVKTLYTNEDYYADDGNMKMVAPSITNDGKFVSVFIVGKSGNTKAIVLNAETGEVRYSIEVGFARPFHNVTHVMICPTDPDLLYFCHEGTTEYVSNRMWLYNAKTGKKYNFAKQRLDEDGNLGDCFGHEMWEPGGKGMYFVKYPQSPIKPTGICHVDCETGKIEVAATGYRYWHVGVSGDGKYLMADTFEPDMNDKSKSEVVVVDLSDGSENVIDVAKKEEHPAHPHPQLSPNNDKLIYTSLDKNNRVVMKIAFLK